MDDSRQPKERGVFLTAEWRDLVMVNFDVDPRVLRARVPEGCELDQWQGRTLVSVVGFLFLDTRVLGVPIPGHRDFEEVNLRFYVRRETAGESRRGVVFVKEIVPRRAVAALARWAYGESYVAFPMDHAIGAEAGDPASDPAETRRVSYKWRREGRWESVSAAHGGHPTLPAPGSEEEFVTEHYWGYARRRDGGTVEYRVEHPQWRVWPALEATVDCDTATLYGPELAEALEAPPSSAFVAEGSAVTVRRGARLHPTKAIRGRRPASGEEGLGDS